MIRDAGYWVLVRDRAADLESDGCTGVKDVYVECCYEHDISYRTCADLEGEPTSKKQDDARFRECIQERSRFGKFSPMSHWRWLGVHIFGRRKCDKDK